VSNDQGFHLSDGIRSVKISSVGRLFITASTPSKLHSLINIDKLAATHVDIVENSPEEKCDFVISDVLPDISDEDILFSLSHHKVKFA